MRKTQFLEVNHRSKNDVTFAEDTDTALLNADKNSKKISINHKKKQRTKQIISSVHKERSKFTLKKFNRNNSSRKPLPNNSNFSRNQ